MSKSKSLINKKDKIIFPEEFILNDEDFDIPVEKITDDTDILLKKEPGIPQGLVSGEKLAYTNTIVNQDIYYGTPEATNSNKGIVIPGAGLEVLKPGVLSVNFGAGLKLSKNGEIILDIDGEVTENSNNVVSSAAIFKFVKETTTKIEWEEYNF